MSDPVYSESHGPRGPALACGLLAALLLTAGESAAYVGPGAGIGVATSFLVFLNALLIGLLSVLLWPFRLLVRGLKRSRLPKRPRCRRVVVLGLDGFSPSVVRELLSQGALPNISRLLDSGCQLSELRTTRPGVSPVAWSSFQTGTNPGKHGVFDFLTPDKRLLVPKLSSVEVKTPPPRRLRIGPLSLTRRSNAVVRGLRGGRPFWSYLARYAIRSAVIRVPITFPPEELDGVLLSGMCVPDLRGTQGSFTAMSPGWAGRKLTGGLACDLTEVGGKGKRGERCWRCAIPGPELPGEGLASSAALTLRHRGGTDWSLSLEGRRGWKKKLTAGSLSGWLPVSFRMPGAPARARKMRSIARFCLRECGEPGTGDPILYATALHIDPASPVLPISHPPLYSRYLARLTGGFATLGLAEDTWALNEGITTQSTFLEQAWSIFDERKIMLDDALRAVKRGLVVCVFDTSDRIQHMFWREGLGEGAPVREMYRRMDSLIGEVASRLTARDVLLVMSDHAFTSFDTCIDLNAWLASEGYLARSPEGSIEWSATRAYSMGMAGIFLNLQGRESAGMVSRSEADDLLEEIAFRLRELRDPTTGERVMLSVLRSTEAYDGPYCEDAPDLLFGTAEGYRAGWGCVTGEVGDRVIYPNERHWTGDHSHEPSLVPGILISSRPLEKDSPAIWDIGPTVLDLLGLDVPSHMDGSSLCPEAAAAGKGREQ
ncbi:alkaline phosphatase family protein [Candidatus Fermentibacterales bacterium]|nr:alkaline phosphatase family protein [Candidatus Fermentibacterales bacterium]